MNRNQRGFIQQTFCGAVSLLALFLGIALSTGCDGSSSPTSPLSPLRIEQAQVSLNQSVVNGMTLSSGSARGGSTLFRATLRDGTGSATGESLWITFERPSGMPMMQPRFLLQDNGLDCDPVALDGQYCHEDFQGHYGFHHEDARPGEYHYDFYAVHHDGRESNHMTVTVTIGGQ